MDREEDNSIEHHTTALIIIRLSIIFIITSDFAYIDNLFSV